MQNYADKNEKINSFRFGDPYEITVDDEGNDVEPEKIEYPLMFVEPQPSKTTDRTRTSTIRVYFCDKVRKGANGELEVLSDMERQCYWFLSYSRNYQTSFHSTSRDWVKVNTDVTLTQFIEGFNAEVTGYWMDVEFITPFEWDLCAIPLKVDVTYLLTDDGNYLTTDNNKKLVYD